MTWPSWVKEDAPVLYRTSTLDTWDVGTIARITEQGTAIVVNEHDEVMPFGVNAIKKSLLKQRAPKPAVTQQVEEIRLLRIERRALAGQIRNLRLTNQRLRSRCQKLETELARRGEA